MREEMIEGLSNPARAPTGLPRGGAFDTCVIRLGDSVNRH